MCYDFYFYGLNTLIQSSGVSVENKVKVTIYGKTYNSQGEAFRQSVLYLPQEYSTRKLLWSNGGIVLEANSTLCVPVIAITE